MGRGKVNRQGRSSKGPPFTPIFNELMDCPTFEALPPLAQCLYWRLRRLAGYDGRRNGEVFLSTRDAAEKLHAHQDTIRKAFYELQAKGFIVATQMGSLGIAGEGKATLWRLTELPTPTDPKPTKEFLTWEPGQDFLVQKGKAPPNKKPKPPLKKPKPVPKPRVVRPSRGVEVSPEVIARAIELLKQSDVKGAFPVQPGRFPRHK